MSEPGLVKEVSPKEIVSHLVEMGEIDTLYRDLYLQRARGLMGSIISHDSYNFIKESVASLGLAERQLRAAVQRGDWKRTNELSERIRSIKHSAEKGADLDLAEAVYDKLSVVPIDKFSSGFYAFFDMTPQALDGLRKHAMDVLISLKTTDPAHSDFYERRRADFESLVIGEQAEKKEETEKVDIVGLRQKALDAVDAGDLAQLDEVMKMMEEAEKASDKEESAAVEINEAAELGDDLLYDFPADVLSNAQQFGLSKVQTKSRRHLAYLVPYSWHPSFLKSESKRWAKDQLSRLTHPFESKDNVKEAVELYLFNPFINSGGTRYQVCLVCEDLLIEDFEEPAPRAAMPDSELLSALGLKTRWGLTRIEIETALMLHGPSILKDKLGLDPEEFRLVAVPPDVFTLLGQDKAWGQHEMWTHFDGYWIRDGGLQALGGGDVRFGGTHDVVSFAPIYANENMLARFAVVQRKRMKTWHKR